MLPQGPIQMPLCVIGSAQTHIGAYRECRDIGVRCADLLQHSQCSIMIAIFKRQQSAVDRGEGLGVVRKRTPGTIDQADRRWDGTVA